MDISIVYNLLIAQDNGIDEKYTKLLERKIMSKIYSLVCFETKESIWIGQGHIGYNLRIYSGEKHISDLEIFLNDHYNKPLYFLDSILIEELLEMDEDRRNQFLRKDKNDTQKNIP